MVCTETALCTALHCLLAPFYADTVLQEHQGAAASAQGVEAA